MNDNGKETADVLIVFTEEMKHLRVGDAQLGIQTVTYGDMRRSKLQDNYKIVLIVGILQTEDQRNTISQLASSFSMKGSYVMGAFIVEVGNIITVPDGIPAYFSLKKSFPDFCTYFIDFIRSLSTLLIEVLNEMGNIENENDEMQAALSTLCGLLNADWGILEYENMGKSITCHSFLNSSYSSPGTSPMLAQYIVSEEFIRKNSIEWMDLQFASMPLHYRQLIVKELIPEDASYYFYIW